MTDMAQASVNRWEHYYTPGSVAEALEILGRYDGEARVVGGGTDLLGLFAGEVRRFEGTAIGENGLPLKIPHMGWSQVRQVNAHPLWEGIADHSRFYFVHSYRVVPEDGATRRADYGIARLQYSLPRGSNIGFLGAGRRTGDTDQGSVGLDTTLFFTETFGFTGQFLTVHGPTAKGGLAWFVRRLWQPQE